MTALNGPILFNSSTGSDSLASGLGPATAVNSTTEGTTASYSTTTITFSGATDLSGVSVGDLLYLVTSTGRKFFAIASVNDGADSLTVDNAPSGTSSGLNWAIGGKRATLDDTNSRQIFSDYNGWTLSLEDNQTITSSLATGASNADLTIQSSVASTLRTITNTANSAVFSVESSTTTLKLYDIKLQCSNATRTAAYGVTLGTSAAGVVAHRCVFGDATNTLAYGIARTNLAGYIQMLSRCRFEYCTAAGILVDQNLTITTISNCVFRYNAYGITGTNNSNGNILGCVFHSNTYAGLVYFVGSFGGLIYVYNCIFYNNGTHGIDGTSGGGCNVYARNNIFARNGGYGIAVPSSTVVWDNNYNAYYSNTSGEVSGIANGDNDITLTANPFVDPANGDFNLNRVTGGGLTLRQATMVLP